MPTRMPTRPRATRATRRDAPARSLASRFRPRRVRARDRGRRNDRPRPRSRPAPRRQPPRRAEARRRPVTGPAAVARLRSNPWRHRSSRIDEQTRRPRSRAARAIGDRHSAQSDGREGVAELVLPQRRLDRRDIAVVRIGEERVDRRHQGGRLGGGDPRVAGLQLVHEVLAAVARNRVEQHQTSTHDPRFAARVAGRRDHHVRCSHQLRDSVGEAERDHVMVMFGECCAIGWRAWCSIRRPPAPTGHLRRVLGRTRPLARRPTRRTSTATQRASDGTPSFARASDLLGAL